MRSCLQVCYVSIWKNAPRVDGFFVPAIKFFEHVKNADPSVIGRDELAQLGPLVGINSALSTPGRYPYLRNLVLL